MSAAPLILDEERVVAARHECGFTQEDLAKKMDVTVQSVYRWEKGEPIKPSNLKRLAECLGKPPDWLLRKSTEQQLTPLQASKLTDAERDLLDSYSAFVEAKNYESAYQIFFEEGGPEANLNYRLDFVYNECRRHHDLLSKLFVDSKPVSVLAQDQLSKLLSSFARSLKNTGQLRRAIDTFQQAIKVAPPAGEGGFHLLTNLANMHRLAGELREATRRVLEARKLALVGRTLGYALYWQGIVASACGYFTDGELLLRRAETEFEEIDDKAGMGQCIAHLSQLELWRGNWHLALHHAQRSHDLYRKHGKHREDVFTNRLIGYALLGLRRLKDARERLEEAHLAANDSGYFEEIVATDIGLASLLHAENEIRPAIERIRKAEELAKRHVFRLLRTDALNTLVRFLSDNNQGQHACATAREALEAALCDRIPHAYAHGLRIAEGHLQALGISHDPSFDIGVPEVQDNATRQTRFYQFIRRMTGAYRYVPSKFLRLFSDEWDSLCQMILEKGDLAPLPPQYFEIHLAEPCNLNCIFCRGGLRDVPEGRGAFASYPKIVSVLHQVAELNPNAFIRFSSLIGEPLLHSKIADILTTATELKLTWGITTNGIKLVDERFYHILLDAKYVHVSLDAGTSNTYRRLKRGDFFDTVLENVKNFVEFRESPRKPQVVVSVVLQSENCNELFDLAVRLKKLGVDCFEIKVQHFDERRRMSEGDLKAAYRDLERARFMNDHTFQIVLVQPESEALNAVREVANRTNFKYCYANRLGLSATLDPHGQVQSCCQYYQETLGPQGEINKGNDLKAIWNGTNRLRILGQRPDVCKNCSPSDQLVNEFVEFLRVESEKDGKFLDWARDEIRDVLSLSVDTAH